MKEENNYIGCRIEVETDFEREQTNLKGRCLVMPKRYMKEFKETILELHKQGKSARQLS